MFVHRVFVETVSLVSTAEFAPSPLFLSHCLELLSIMVPSKYDIIMFNDSNRITFLAFVPRTELHMQPISCPAGLRDL